VVVLMCLDMRGSKDVKASQGDIVADIKLSPCS